MTLGVFTSVTSIPLRLVKVDKIFAIREILFVSIPYGKERMVENGARGIDYLVDGNIASILYICYS